MDIDIDNPVYVSNNGTVTSTRVIEVSTTHPNTEVSFTEDAIIYFVGNVSNTGIFRLLNLQISLKGLVRVLELLTRVTIW